MEFVTETGSSASIIIVDMWFNVTFVMEYHPTPEASDDRDAGR